MNLWKISLVLITTATIALTLLIVVCLVYCDYQDPVKPESGQSLSHISWTKAHKLLTAGKIHVISQAQDDVWWLYPIEGEPLTTTQVRLEAVYNTVDQCGDAMCASIEVANGSCG